MKFYTVFINIDNDPKSIFPTDEGVTEDYHLFIIDGHPQLLIIDNYLEQLSSPMRLISPEYLS